MKEAFASEVVPVPCSSNLTVKEADPSLKRNFRGNYECKNTYAVGWWNIDETKEYLWIVNYRWKYEYMNTSVSNFFR